MSKWSVALGQAKSKWARLTNNDLKNIAGKKDQLIGKIQVRYGVLKGEAEEQVDRCLESVNLESPGATKKSNGDS